ncbi:S-adenosylmethionine:tRNA ribosyltransferase-isomerase [Lewinella marina]|uniref:S-adenosylmethionine tRNA ribosyltransferase n=1 Tax=Neolewinella marina TaxID=438751 RepID=A0A2G0CDF7_9BACT|nr:S-adenosylmethionine:tRNA ribosyltransferase-isomerase [Neolewinella marina]NJB86025.1 S-adenosylmethionine:tRNA ribosyltransferase-isomerase [Neolewinella marina]PHK98009.1 S-adenosylmethionine tRNA ribosyltransferase [Neolewinella marina]
MTPDARALRIDDYDYALPDERIARYPLPDRARAKLLHYRAGEMESLHFADLPDLLPAGTLVIGNQTRVIHARLHFTLADERPLEIFCLEPLEPADYALSLGSTTGVSWKCLVGGNRRWKSGEIDARVNVGGTDCRLTARRGKRLDNAFRIEFSWQADRPLSFGEVLEAAGSIPLPPYLGRPAEAEDRDRYQTVFAEREGSVAAPTAGLHFTPGVMERLRERGSDFRTLTLHVGAGTFKPVTSDTLGDHVMHREYFSVDRELVRALHAQKAAGRPVVSVGTTSMRCLESLYYFGARLLAGDPAGDSLDQWVGSDPRLTSATVAPALAALLQWMEVEGRENFSGYTQLLLTPAVRPRVVDGLITNFHQPRSTLLLLVASLVGEDWRRIYDFALGGDFRFLSYGDSSLLWRRGAGAE